MPLVRLFRVTFVTFCRLLQVEEDYGLQSIYDSLHLTRRSVKLFGQFFYRQSVDQAAIQDLPFAFRVNPLVDNMLDFRIGVLSHIVTSIFLRLP